MAYKHIIWDWNGTLLDDNQLAINSINTVLQRYRLPTIELENYLEIFTFPVVEYYAKLGFDFKKNPFEKVGTEFIEEYTAGMFDPHLHSAASITLSQIDKSKTSQSLLSAAKQQMLDTLMRYHKLETHFINVIGLDNHYAYSKLDAGRNWMNVLEHGPHEVLFIGDTIHDVDVAQQIGADCILVSHGHTNHARLLTTGVPVFHSFTEMQPWLRAKLIYN